MKQTQLINGFKITLKLSNSKKPTWSDRLHNHYKVTIANGLRRLSFDFFGSVVMREKNIHPKISETLYSFALDCMYGKQSFEDYCSELGYDADYRKQARKTWKQCASDAKRAERLGITDAILEEWSQFE